MTRPLSAVLVGLCCLPPLVAGAQPWSPDSITLSVPGGGAQCSYIEVVMTSGLTMGHESTSVVSAGASFVEGWDEKCGWGKGPCAAGPGTGEWNPAIGYGGPLHLVYMLTGAAEARFSVVWDDGNVGPPIYTTHQYPVAITPAAAKTVGLWATRPDLPADGTSTATLSVAATGPACGALKNTPITLTTSLGRLRAGTQEGSSITVTTGSNGRATATLVAATTAGTAHITANVAGATAETVVRMLAKSLTVTAAPTQIDADGTSSTTISATAKDANDVPASGERVVLSTDRGTLTAGTASGMVIEVVTGASGVATASLVSSGQAGKATVSGAWSDAHATTEVLFVGYTLELLVTEARYTMVPATTYPSTRTSTRTIAPGASAEVTLNGRTEVPITVRLRAVPEGGQVAGKIVRLSSAERDAVGASLINFLPVVTTDSAGEATTVLRVEQLWTASAPPTAIHLRAELDNAPATAATFDATVVDNLNRVLREYYEKLISPGPLAADRVVVEALLADVAKVDPDVARQVELLLASGLRGAANNALGLLGALVPQWNGVFNLYACGGYQDAVLALLDGMRLNQVRIGGAVQRTDWLLNGLDYGPIHLLGGAHVAAMIYPRVNETNPSGDWKLDHTLVLDPWLTQSPVGAEYPWRTWARPGWLPVVSGSAPIDVTPSSILGSQRLNTLYPANASDYPVEVSKAALGSPGFNLDRIIVVDCPVLITIEDTSGKLFGYLPAGGDVATVMEGVHARFAHAVAADGTMGWLFELPRQTFTLHLAAYGPGTMNLVVTSVSDGTQLAFANVPVSGGLTGVLVLDPDASLVPMLALSDGRSVAGALQPIGPAVGTTTGATTGGTEVNILGFAGGSVTQVTFGGKPATAITVKGDYLVTVVAPADAEGTVDVVVTSNGVPTTLHQAFTFVTPPPSVSYLAEGATSPFFDTRLALLNPGATATTATLTFARTGGSAVVHTLSVPARTRVTLDPKTLPGLATAEFSTKVESDLPLIVDRTLSWDATGYGAHAETAVAAPALTWYLAEGATHSGFSLFYLLQNPNAAAAEVRVRFLRPSGAPLEKTYTLPPTSRSNIWVNEEDFPGLGKALAATDVSAILDSLNDQPIIVERALYLDLPGQMFGAGHESAGVTAPALQWFLAEGNTGPYFDLFVLIANPGDTDAQVEATYLRPDGTVVVTQQTVGANSRFNIWVDGEDPLLADTAVSTTIRSTNGVPVIVERALWWPGSYGQWYEAHNSPGATSTGTRWALAEGEVGGTRGVETYILLANTSPATGDVNVTLLFEDGTSAEKTFTVAGNSRFNVDVRSEFAAARGTRFGAIVESLGATPAQIVVERAMYWDAGGQHWAAGTNALATKLQ